VPSTLKGDVSKGHYNVHSCRDFTFKVSIFTGVHFELWRSELHLHLRKCKVSVHFQTIQSGSVTPDVLSPTRWSGAVRYTCVLWLLEAGNDSTC
jgi:hypothetical protein